VSTFRLHDGTGEGKGGEVALSRRKFLSTGSGLAASALILPTIGNLAGCTTPGALAVSFGSIDITPEIAPTSDPDRMLNPFMGGYGVDRRMSAGPGGPLYARCTVLSRPRTCRP
jgi:hypothetical protein